MSKPDPMAGETVVAAPEDAVAAARVVETAAARAAATVVVVDEMSAPTDIVVDKASAAAKTASAEVSASDAVLPPHAPILSEVPATRDVAVTPPSGGTGGGSRLPSAE